MNFVSYAELYSDIAKWERELPAFDAVCGVPRSGLIPAAYISLRRNIRLVSFESLLACPEKAIANAPLRDNNPLVKNSVKYGNRLLVIDDSTSIDSKTFHSLEEKLKGQTALDITTSAIYRASKKSHVDLYYKDLALPRLFEWNWFRNAKLKDALLDMDGVITVDWYGKPEQDVDFEFIRHVKSAKPLFPPQVPIRGIVTSRIERYRDLTKQWLAKHGVVYDFLLMHPAGSPEERRTMGDHAERKAAAYLSDRGAKLFIESSIKQAEIIFKITSKPVLCIDNMTMYK